MDTIQDARRVLSATEASLRQLIEQGLKEQRYSEIVEIAKLADGVARLLHTPQAAFASPPEITANATSLPSPISRASSAKRIPTKRDYPRFERDGDRLVKIGWSKRRKGLYEHRASRQAVVAFARRLSESVPDGKVFVVDELLPVADANNGAEIPAYQVYLTLAWLRQNGAVIKKGRDGYLLRRGALANGAFDKLWSGLPRRTA